MRYLAASLIALILGYIGFLNPVRDGYVDFVSPIQFGMRQGALTLKDTLDFFSRVRTVRDNNLSLSQKVLELESIIVELKKVQAENEILKEQLGVGDKALLERDLVLAGVMGNPNDTADATIFVDKGSDDGIKPGDNVIKSNYILGIVRSVTHQRSLVDLIISPEVSATVYDIDSPEKTEGLASGQYGSFVRLERVLPGETLEVGDRIVTSGKDGIFYPGLYLGKVSYIFEDPAQPLKAADVEVLLEFSSIEKVFILKME